MGVGIGGGRAGERDRGRQPVGQARGAVDAASDALVIEVAGGARDRADRDHGGRAHEQGDADGALDGVDAEQEHRDQGQGRGQDRRGGGALERPLAADPPPRARQEALDRRRIDTLHDALLRGGGHPRTSNERG